MKTANDYINEKANNKRKRYLCNEFKGGNFEFWNNDEHILIVANAGDGKTTLMLDKFTSWAEQQEPMRRVLYLHNRNIMKDQFADRYSEGHKNLKICSYQGIEKKAKEINTDVQSFINSFDYILCDECHYFVSDAAFNETTYLSYEAVDRCKGTAIYFTATPKYFLRMKNNLTKSLNIIYKNGLNPKNIKEIFLAKNLNIFDKFEKKSLEEQKVIHFENDSDNLKYKAECYANMGYKAEMLVAEKNKNEGYMNKEVVEQIKHSTDENGNDIANVFTDWLGCTSAYENGINFNIEGSVLVSFTKYINWTSLEQSRSRIRNFNNNNVNMLICIPHKGFLNKVTLKKKFLIDYLKVGQEKTDRNAVFGGNAYNRFNDFRIAFHEIELEEIEAILYAADKIEYYKQKLHELYPNAKIRVIDNNNLIDIDSTIKEFMGDNEEIDLINAEEKQRFIKIINRILKDKEHIGRIIKLNKISKKLIDLNSNYRLIKYSKPVKVKNVEGKATTATKWTLKKYVE